MALLYILLIIIAIGVLLMSQEGKELLGVLAILACIAGGLYVGFWAIMIAIALISSEDLRESIRPVILFIGCVVYGIIAIWYLIHLWKTRKQIPGKIKALPKKWRDSLLESWRKQRTATIVGIVAFVALITSILVIILNWE